ncbi:MAG: elongation factor P [Candidatus Latescibacteria bacterium]|nr:elongation factor P [Candidatus Latescibacterota bacterium]
MASTANFRNGMTLMIDGRLFSIADFQHVKPGKGGAFVRTKLKNVLTGAVIDRTFRAGERVEEVRIDQKPMQYLYRAGDEYYFMDTETYDQFPLPNELIGELIPYLKEGEMLSVMMHGDTPIGAELPFFVELRIKQTDPGLKGDTATGGSKPATMETGAVVQVPLFINEGDRIKVDTRTGTYVERVT